MNLKILVKEHKEVYKKFNTVLKKSRVAIDKENKTKTKYLVATYEDNPIGVVGYCYLTDYHVRFKIDYVNPYYRGKKVYTKLWNKRMNIIFKDEKVRKITAYCTEMSLPKYLKEGFIIQSVSKSKITYVRSQVFFRKKYEKL